MRRLSSRELELTKEEKSEYMNASEQCKHFASVFKGLGMYIQGITLNQDEAPEFIAKALKTIRHIISYENNSSKVRKFEDMKLTKIPWTDLGIKDVIDRLKETMYTPDEDEQAKIYGMIENGCYNIEDALTNCLRVMKVKENNPQFDSLIQTCVQQCNDLSSTLQVLARRIYDEAGGSW